MFSYLIGIIGSVIALVGWFVFHSPIATIIGTALYIVETILEWNELKKAKLFDVIVLIFGCIIGLFIQATPWYICGLLAINIYSFICVCFSLVILLSVHRGK